MMRSVHVAFAAILALALCACEEAKDLANQTGEVAKEVARDPKLRKTAEDAAAAGEKAVNYVSEKGSGVIMSVKEKVAFNAFRDIVEAGRQFARSDMDGNGINDYWAADVAGLYCLVKAGEPIAAVGRGTAAADAHPIGVPYEHKGVVYDFKRVNAKDPEPKSGYLFQMIQRDADGKHFADPKKKVFLHRTSFAVTGYPAKYKQTGTWTYIAVFRKERGRNLYRRDTEGKPVLKWPSKEELEAKWEFVEGETFGK